MNPHDIVQSALNRAREVVDSMRRQAPGARMVGEFAVRIASRDVARRLRGATRSGTEESPPSGANPGAPKTGDGADGE